MPPLQTVFQAIAQAPDQAAVRAQIQAACPYFAAQRSGLFFFDQLLHDPRFQKILQVGFSLEHNPVARYLVEHHAPVHEALVTSPKAWQLICPRRDHWHVMAGPVVSRGQLVGAVGFTRSRGMAAFQPDDLANLSGLCLHVSTWAAWADARQAQPGSLSLPGQSKAHCLTRREREIAELVAQGQTNAAIGAALWITENSVKQALKRMFRKLEVSSRAELVAVLVRL